ncbi:MAG: helix-turn-helix domain-containing protein [Syntrophobacteria bacterium]
MARPSKKGAKTEAEVAAEARRKKEILDRVAQSNIPTKTILKELGISRSTYYSWLKRYEEEGDEGLLDSRSLAKDTEEVEETAPAVEEILPQPSVTVAAEEAVEEKPPEPVAEEVIEEEPVPPPPEETVVKPEEPVATPTPVEPEKTEEVTIPEPMMPHGGDQTRKGLGRYGFIAVMLLVVGLLLSISISNHGTYQLRKDSNSLTLWKGKFAPRGYEMVEAFEPVVVDDADVSALTGRTYTGKEDVHRAIFAFFMDQVNVETARGDELDIDKMNLLLARAETFAESNGAGDANLASMRFQLAQQRVGMAELGLHKAYQKALPIYQEALKAGLADAAMLEAKVGTMQEALGLVPVVAPEAPEQQAEVSITEEQAGKEAAISGPPETVAKEVETPAVAEEPAKEEEAAVAEESAKEEEAAVTPGVGAEETLIPAKVESSIEEGETVPAETETDSTVEQTNPEEETDKATSFMEWLKAKQQ